MWLSSLAGPTAPKQHFVVIKSLDVILPDHTMHTQVFVGTPELGFLHIDWILNAHSIWIAQLLWISQTSRILPLQNEEPLDSSTPRLLDSSLAFGRFIFSLSPDKSRRMPTNELGTLNRQEFSTHQFNGKNFMKFWM